MQPNFLFLSDIRPENLRKLANIMNNSALTILSATLNFQATIHIGQHELEALLRGSVWSPIFLQCDKFVIPRSVTIPDRFGALVSMTAHDFDRIRHEEVPDERKRGITAMVANVRDCQIRDGLSRVHGVHHVE